MDILQIFELFPTHKACIEYLETARWDNKPECPTADLIGLDAPALGIIAMLAVPPTVSLLGTIFHHTHLPLQKWFLAISMILGAKKGISALQLSRSLKINKNTAWRISMQIRKAMSQADQRDLLTGVVEMDETISVGNREGGAILQTTRQREAVGPKRLQLSGLSSCGGRVTAKAVTKDKMKGEHLRAFVRDRVDTEQSQLITDEYRATWECPGLSLTPSSSIRTGM